MNIVVFGKGERAARCLAVMAGGGYCPVGVLAEGGDAELAAAANELGVPLLPAAESVFEVKPDLLVLIGYTKILKEPMISLPQLGTINLHGGKLPDYRGASVINWQIINGEREGGVAVLYVDEGIDTGDIIAEERFPIAPEDTIKEVVEKTLEIFPRLLLGALRDVERGTVARKKQPRAGTYYHKRRPEDGKISWLGMSAESVHNLVRALARPYPGAFTSLGGEKVFIWATRLLSTETFRGIPGRIVGRRDGGVVVIANDRGLLVTAAGREEGGTADALSFLAGNLGATFDA